jgi:hypothetical protein
VNLADPNERKRLRDTLTRYMATSRKGKLDQEDHRAIDDYEEDFVASLQLQLLDVLDAAVVLRIHVQVCDYHDICDSEECTAARMFDAALAGTGGG